MPNGTQHISEEVLENYHFKRLEPSQLDTVENHLLLCEPCRERLVEVEEMAVAFREAAKRLPEPIPTSTGPNFWRWPQLAGAFAALTLGAVLVRPLLNPGPVTEINMSAVRGSGNENRISHKGAAVLNVELEGLNPAHEYRFELADDVGQVVASQKVQPQNGRLRVVLASPPPAGHYWARIYAANQKDPEREFSLIVRPD